MTDGLLTWLREQIADTRRIAEATRDQPSDSGRWEVVAGDTIKVVSAGRVFVRAYDVPEEDAEHIVLNDPYAVLAQCEAHTAILDLVNLDFNDDGQPVTLGGYGEAYWDVVRLIAHAYRHRPGYREEWT